MVKEQKVLYDYLFQVKLIVSLLKNELFLAEIHDILELSYFDASGCKWLVNVIKNYYNKYRSIPTFSVLKTEYFEVENEVLKTTINETVRDLKKYLGSKDLIFVQEKTKEFCRNKRLGRAILKSVQYLDLGQYDKIKIEIDEAIMAGTDINLGSNYVDDIEIRYNAANRKMVKTPWPIINELLDGGLGKGELGVVFGAQGSGKSWLLAAIGAQAVKNGHNVLHYTLELSEEYTGLRYDAIFTQIPFQELKYHKEKVKKTVAKYKNRLIIKEFPASSITSVTLHTNIKQLEMRGFIPHLIIIDYGDLLLLANKDKLFGGGGGYTYYGAVYEEIRGLAGELRTPIWTASQGNRASLTADITKAEHAADSIKKVGIGDFIFSFSRKTEDKVTNTARAHIIKNRFGPDGMTYNCKANLNTGKIVIYDNDTEGSYEQGKKMEDQDVIRRKLIREKLNNMGARNER